MRAVTHPYLLNTPHKPSAQSTHTHSHTLTHSHTEMLTSLHNIQYKSHNRTYLHTHTHHKPLHIGNDNVSKRKLHTRSSLFFQHIVLYIKKQALTLLLTHAHTHRHTQTHTHKMRSSWVKFSHVFYTKHSQMEYI